MIVMPGALLLLIMTLGSQGRQGEVVAVDDEDDENDGGGWGRMGTGDNMHDAALCPRNKNNGNKQRLRDFPLVKPASCRCTAAFNPAHLIASIKDDTFPAARSPMMIVICTWILNNSPICACTSCCSQHTRPYASTLGYKPQPLCEIGTETGTSIWFANNVSRCALLSAPTADVDCDSSCGGIPWNEKL
jgi:hypothetical protein